MDWQAYLDASCDDAYVLARDLKQARRQPGDVQYGIKWRRTASDHEKRAQWAFALALHDAPGSTNSMQRAARIDAFMAGWGLT